MKTVFIINIIIIHKALQFTQDMNIKEKENHDLQKLGQINEIVELPINAIQEHMIGI